MKNDEKRAVFLGAVLGAVFGSIFAVLCRRWAYQRRLRGGKPIQVRQVMRLSLSLLPMVRQLLKLIS